MRRVHANLDCGGVGGKSLRRSIAFSWVLAAVVFALTERDALASCGDYVMVGGSGHGQDQSPAGPHDVPVCSGPHCQRQIPLSPAPKPLVQTSPQESACTLTVHRPESDGGSSLVSEPSDLAPQTVFVPPDRPPRASR